MTDLRKITVVLGEFSAPMSHGLAHILSHDSRVELVARALKPGPLEKTVSAQSPDVALLNEQAAASRSLVSSLCTAHPSLSIVVLAHEPSRQFALCLLSYGVAACIPRDSSAEDILEAIHLTVVDGIH